MYCCMLGLTSSITSRFDPIPFFDTPLQVGINLYTDKDHLNNYGFEFLVPHFEEFMRDITTGKPKKMVYQQDKPD